jgi:uncharacterized protein YdhG (YjbR/CyaY superfamily)
MGAMNQRFASVDEYIDSFPADVQAVLQQVRRTIRQAVATSEETISYHIPTIMLDGVMLLYFAGWKHHVSIYPAPAGNDQLEQELAPYRSAKSTLKFPIREPVPYDLIGRVAALRLEERRDRQTSH